MSRFRSSSRGGRYAPLFAPARMLPRREPWGDADAEADARDRAEEQREIDERHWDAPRGSEW